jgi:hypothetical protein
MNTLPETALRTSDKEEEKKKKKGKGKNILVKEARKRGHKVAPRTIWKRLTQAGYSVSADSEA